MVASVKSIIERTRFSDQVFKLLDAAASIHYSAIRDSLHEIGGEATRFMRTSLRTGTKTGRWYKFRGRPHRASAPGETPAKMSGKLSRSINRAVRGASELEVGSIMSEEYPEHLEFGTRKMLRRPFIEPTSDRYANRTAILMLRFTRVALSKGRGTRI